MRFSRAIFLVYYLGGPAPQGKIFTRPQAERSPTGSRPRPPAWPCHTGSQSIAQVIFSSHARCRMRFVNKFRRNVDDCGR